MCTHYSVTGSDKPLPSYVGICQLVRAMWIGSSKRFSLETKILCTTKPYLFMACLLAKDKVNGLTTQRPIKRGKEHKMKDKTIFERLLMQIGSIHNWEMTKLAPSCTQKQPNINTFSSLMVLLAMYLVESYDQCTCSC